LDEERKAMPKPPEPENLKTVDIIFGKQFKLVLFENGDLYSWGISPKG